MTAATLARGATGSGAGSSPRGVWGRRNWRLLAVFAPVLIATGLAGLTLPPPPARLALMSTVVPYDVFHLAFGALGLALVLTRSTRGTAIFNLAFGGLDLYQALAGAVGIFPTGLFGLRPADHVVHVVLGALLCVFGARFFAARG